MGKSASLSTGGGNTTFTATFVYANAKFTELVTIAAEANGLTLADIQALTTQQQANWIMDNVVLYGWKQWARDAKLQEALASAGVYDFDSTNGG